MTFSDGKEITREQHSVSENGATRTSGYSKFSDGTRLTMTLRRASDLSYAIDMKPWTNLRSSRITELMKPGYTEKALDDIRQLGEGSGPILRAFFNRGGVRGILNDHYSIAKYLSENGGKIIETGTRLLKQGRCILKRIFRAWQNGLGKRVSSEKTRYTT